MTARKIKHARALAKREEYMKTVHEGNISILNKVRDQRAEEQKKAEKEARDRKIEKSKELARKNNATPPGVAKHKPLPKNARKKINKKEES